MGSIFIWSIERNLGLAARHFFLRCWFHVMGVSLHGSLWFGKDKGSIMESAESDGTIL